MPKVETETRQLSLASYLALSLWPLYQATGEHVARAIGRPVRLMAGSSFDQFASGEVDFGFI
jgi:hypothetical protein